MPPREPAETVEPSVAAEELAAIRQKSYDEGYAAGLEAGKPKLPLFEAAKKRVKVEMFKPWSAVRQIIADIEAEYDEKLRAPDVDLLRAHYDRLHTQIRREQDASSRAVQPAPSETEYEVIR